MDILKRAGELLPLMIEDRRYLHQNPEIAHDLPKTTAYVKKKLIEIGLEPQDCGDNGIVAVVGKGEKCFMIRADMDALPMNEESGLPFASTCNMAHTCGHDIHTAMLLGAARILKEMENELQGQVKLMFQPAEECMTGAKSMIDAGLMENPKVDAAAAIHIMSLMDLGKIYYGSGTAATSNDIFEIEVKGFGGHGATPHNTVDPINVGAHIVIALQEIIAREVSPTDMAVLTIGSFNGGTVGNIIPEKVVITGSIRAYKPEVRELIKKRCSEIVSSVASTFRAKAEFKVMFATPAVFNNVEVTEILAEGIKELLGEAMTGSEDFAYVSDLVPSTFFILGGNPGDRGKPVGHHNPKVYFDESAMVNGAATYVKVASCWLENNI